jgi:indole-3-glycerol phosphate synthase
VILNQILQNSRAELEARKRQIPLEEMQGLALTQPQPLDLYAALQGNKIRLIAEIKKASPSRGVICPDFDPIEIARTYTENHAAAISVLTDTKYFRGSLDYIRQIVQALGNTRPPILRKDFIFDPYQIYETRACGADALLLIAAVLKFAELKELLQLSHSLHLQCLVEAHNESEVDMAVSSGARLIGINNRDLNTFKVDIDTTARLRPLIPADRIVVSESGIRTRQDMAKLQLIGVNAVLVGEALMASKNIAARMKELL